MQEKRQTAYTSREERKHARSDLERMIKDRNAPTTRMAGARLTLKQFRWFCHGRALLTFRFLELFLEGLGLLCLFEFSFTLLPTICFLEIPVSCLGLLSVVSSDSLGTASVLLCHYRLRTRARRPSHVSVSR